MIYPSIRNAVFSAVMDWYGGDDSRQDDQEFATELTDQIMAALARVKGNPLALNDD